MMMQWQQDDNDDGSHDDDVIYCSYKLQIYTHKLLSKEIANFHVSFLLLHLDIFTSL